MNTNSIAFLIAVQVLSVSAAQPFIEKLDLFKVGDLGYRRYHIPGVVVTAKGTVLASCEERKKDGDWADIRILPRRSTDDGKSWSEPKLIANVTGPIAKNPFALRLKNINANDVTCNNPVALELADGRVMLNVRNKSKNSTSPNLHLSHPNAGLGNPACKDGKIPVAGRVAPRGAVSRVSSGV